MPLEQAEMLADQHARVFGEELATKQDVVLLRADLVAMEQRIKDQLTVRLGVMMAGAIAIVATLVRLLRKIRAALQHLAVVGQRAL